MRAALILAVLLAVGLSGCLGEGGSPIALRPVLPMTETAPGDPLDVALRATSTSPFKQTLEASVEAPAGWNASLDTTNVTIRGRADLPLVLRADLPANVSYGLHTLFIRLGESTFDLPVVVRDLREARASEEGRVELRVTRISAEGAIVATDDPLVRANATPGERTRLSEAEDDARGLTLREPALREGEARAERTPDGGVLIVRVARIDASGLAPGIAP